MPQHFALEYVGKPWARGADGPEAFDCWGLVREVERRHFGRELPEAPERAALLDTAREVLRRGQWLRTIAPREGDGVIIRYGPQVHVGVYLDADGGGVLHAVEGVGVIYTLVTDLRHNGWTRVEYYTPAADLPEAA
jgi:cell wall-associated NlpC family hydrolase